MTEAPIVPPPGKDAEDFMVVGIGASAGGLKALLEFFEHVPENPGMAFVVIVHLSPEHESHISELLQQATAMPVHAVTGVTPTQPNHVYVISPKFHLRIADGTLEPTPAPSRRGTTMTIDLFLETLAQAHSTRAAGIVLSGSGSDGTLGVRGIRAQGGVTLAQAPEEAEYDAMPRTAIASGVIDFVLSAKDMPAKLVELWRNAKAIRVPSLPDVAAPEDAMAQAEEALRVIVSTLRARTGHDFSHYKRPTLLRRIERRLQVNQLHTLAAYRDYIAEHPPETAALLADLLISVTWFFRDPEAWKVVEDRVIPDVLAGRDDGQVRVWVVGCATGEEVYSLAMLFQERIDTMTRPPKISIFATDIDEPALATARAALYPETIAEHVPAGRLHRFFTREHASYRVSKPLREMVMFAAHNVVQDPPFSRLDLVCCRNLLIYLNRSLQEKVLDVLHFSLRPDGYLFLGMSESVDDGHDGFDVVDKAHRLFVQQPRARIGMMLNALPLVNAGRPASDLSGAMGRRMVSYTELHQRLLEHYAAPSLVVDDRYDIVHLSDRAGHFLQLGPGEPSLNLMKVAPDELRYELKSALDEAIASMRTIERTGLAVRRGAARLQVDVKVHPVRDKSSGRTFALIVFDEAGAAQRASDDALAEAEFAASSSSPTTRLEERLHDVEAQLRAAVEQYEVQNEELKASNEELQATNEELRAATEELETGKEELQSINEELTTVNQELKNKVDEATRVSDDLQNFITATEIASLFVDRQMRLLRYTPFARGIFNLIPADIGRPLLDITHRLEGVDLEREIARVFESLHVVELEARASDSRWYIVRILPYRTTEDRIRGAVLTFVDISQRRAAEQAVLRSEAWAQIVIESVSDYAIMTLDPSGVIETWNDGGRRIFGYSPEDIVGKHFEALFTPEDRSAKVPQAELEAARKSGRAHDDRWLVRKDGSRFFASGMTAPMMVSDNDGFVKLLRDASEQQQAVQRTGEALSAERDTRVAAEEASQLKDDFLAMLSHELRNPLALMLMQSEILLRAPEAAKAPKLRQAAQVIHEMVEAQSQLVHDMLDVSRARTGKLAIDRQLLPLTFLIAGSMGALRNEAEQKAITLDVKIDETPLIVEADPLRVRQIAWNLLSNAIKFTPRGGTIRVRLQRENGDARLDIEDTGQGMEPKVARHVFDWSRRVELAPSAREGGLGIGLALVRQLVDLHGGRVEAFSEGPGKGARFTVWLPLESADTPQSPGQRAALHEERPLEGLKILLVDDSQANGEALRELLRLVGASAEVETSAESALSRLNGDSFDVVISDIAMPGMDGYTFLEKVRASKSNSHTRAIALSGYGSSRDIERAKKAGFDAHLTKPADVQNLVATIRSVSGK